jgi:hypothetical protein
MRSESSRALNHDGRPGNSRAHSPQQTLRKPSHHLFISLSIAVQMGRAVAPFGERAIAGDFAAGIGTRSP